jgi:H+/Cl- antiporter ClcA
LGLAVIQDALQTPLSFWDPFYKFILTCITLGSGFKGGEFTPLVFIGSTFGNALAPFLSLPHSFMAALGFAAVFGAAANTPMACAVMAAEIFGWIFFPYVLVCTYVAYWASGTHGIYAGQR